jgi:ADP-ribose pyrophosphatase YjhB (NUDIX family)
MFARVCQLLRRLLALLPWGGTERQFGAVTYRRGAAGLEFMLVTSRRTGRWIFPKGGCMPGLSPSECAAQEAFEEAGVEGRIGNRSIGSYQTIKVRDTGTVPIEVEMYPLAVEVELSDWPEKDQRHRRWASRGEACALLSDPQLVEIVQEFPAGDAVDGPAGGAEPDRQ